MNAKILLFQIPIKWEALNVEFNKSKLNLHHFNNKKCHIICLMQFHVRKARYGYYKNQENNGIAVLLVTRDVPKYNQHPFKGTRDL